MNSTKSLFKTVSIVPTMILPALIYAALTSFTSTSKPMAVWNLSSGDMTVLTVGQMIILLGIICLGIEVIKATRMSAWGMADHVASLALLLVMAILYLTVFGYGNGTWFLLCAMQTMKSKNKYALSGIYPLYSPLILRYSSNAFAFMIRPR